MRRSLPAHPVVALVALALGACAQLQPQFEGVESDVNVTPATPPASEDKPAVPPEMQAQFDACLAGLRDDAAAAGISEATFTANTKDLVPDPSVLELLNRQPEFSTPIWDYMAGLVDEERVADGRAMLAAHADVLRRVLQRYGVDPATVVAVWGVESDYGRTFGSRPLLASLATLSCFDRRQDFFRGELFSTLHIIQSGDIGAEELRGYRAGAFGHTQFMPSTFQRIAVDFDGDGRRDLIGSVPDALGSTAHYLQRAGWRSGQPWGYEVRVPKGFDARLAGRTDRRALSDWLRRGIERVDGRPIDLPGNTRAALLLPAGIEGPAFLVFRNFDAIYSYNASESYALAIAHLSDRLRGGAGFATPWPTDDPGLSRRERRELQMLLLARGHDIGEADGIIGSRTREAIRREQQRLGQAVDGRAGQRLLRALRGVRR
jgi:glucose-6-phosphate 1-epimerase